MTADDALQMLGGRGYDEANGIARLWRDARLLRIFEGPTEVLRNHLGTLATSRPRGLRALVGDVLGRVDIADAVVAAIAALQDRTAAATFPDATRRDQWLDDQAGAIATATVLWAVGGDWGHQRFLTAAAVNAEPLPDVGDLLEAIAGYGAAIGDLAMGLPGEAWDPDPLLFS